MANLIDFRIVKSEVERISEDFSDRGLSEPSKAFVFYAIKKILPDLSEEEILAWITDGSHDRGLDGIYFKDDGEKFEVFLFQMKYATKQEKIDDCFAWNETNKIFTLLSDILESVTISNAHSMLMEKIDEFRSYINDEKISKINICFCSNTRKWLAPAEETTFKDRLAREFKGKCDAKHFWLAEMVADHRYSINKSITPNSMQYFQIPSIENIKGCICAVDAENFLQSLVEESNELNPDLFEDNVRRFLWIKKANGYNNKIKETALDSKENQFFFFYNNWVTIVCDDFVMNPELNRKNPRIDIQWLQIVNWQQTVHSLFEAYKEDRDVLGESSMSILVRIYATRGNSSIAGKIAEFTNSQNPIRTRDIRSNDELQKSIEKLLGAEWFYYERKANLYKEQQKNRRVDAEELGQILNAFWNWKTSTNHKKEVFLEQFYEDIFTNGDGVEHYLFPFQLFRKISILRESLRHEIKEGNSVEMNFVIHASLALLRMIKSAMDKDGDDVFKFDEKNIERVMGKYYLACVQLLRKATESAREGNPESYTHNNFFKADIEKRLEEYSTILA